MDHSENNRGESKDTNMAMIKQLLEAMNKTQSILDDLERKFKSQQESRDE